MPGICLTTGEANVFLGESYPSLIKMHVIIIGCGIAGLSAAIGFRKYGHDVTILERAPYVAPVSRYEEP